MNKTIQELGEEIKVSDIFNQDKLKQIDILKDNTKERSSLFFSIDLLKRKNIYGYCQINDFIKEIQKELIQERIYNGSIEVIEWADRFLVCFKDGVYISTVYRHFKKDNFNNFIKLNFKGGF